MTNKRRAAESCSAARSPVRANLERPKYLPEQRHVKILFLGLFSEQRHPHGTGAVNRLVSPNAGGGRDGKANQEFGRDDHRIRGGRGLADLRHGDGHRGARPVARDSAIYSPCRAPDRARWRVAQFSAFAIGPMPPVVAPNQRGASEWQLRGPWSQSHPHFVQPLMPRARTMAQITAVRRFPMTATIADRALLREHWILPGSHYATCIAVIRMDDVDTEAGFFPWTKALYEPPYMRFGVVPRTAYGAPSLLPSHTRDAAA